MTTHRLLDSLALAPLALAAVAALAPAGHADTLRVPKDHPTIADAVEAAQPGDVVLISAGEYTEYVRMSDRPDLTIRGVGKVRMLRSEVLAAEFGLDSVPAFEADDCKGLRIENIRFEGLWTAVDIERCNGLVVEDCRFEGGQEFPALNIFNCYAFRVTDCRFADLTEAIRAFSVRRGVLEDNEIQRVTTGITLRASSEMVVRRNRIADVDTGVRTLEFAAWHEVAANRITDASVAGIDLELEGGTVHANVLRRCADGIRTAGVDGSAADGGTHIAGNRISQSSGTGLWVGGRGCTVRGNVVRQSGTVGIRVLSAWNHLVDNKVVQTGGAGISLEEGANTYADNTIKKTGGPAVDDSDPDSNIDMSDA